MKLYAEGEKTLLAASWRREQKCWLFFCTLEEPDVPRLVFICCVDVVRNTAPVARRQGRVAALQTPVTDSPNISRPEEEELSPDHGHGIKACPAGVRLGKTDSSYSLA